MRVKMASIAGGAPSEPARTSGMGHQDNQGHLAHDGRFSRHIGACDNQRTAIFLGEMNRVGNELTLREKGFDDRMASLDDLHLPAGMDFGR